MSTYDNNVLYRPLTSTGNNANYASSLCNWIKHIKVYKIICLILILLFVIPMLAHYYILNVSKCCTQYFGSLMNFIFSQVEPEINEAEIHHSRSQLDVYEDISNLRASDLKLRIEEMLRIKVFGSHHQLKNFHFLPRWKLVLKRLNPILMAGNEIENNVFIKLIGIVKINIFLFLFRVPYHLNCVNWSLDGKNFKQISVYTTKKLTKSNKI